MRESPYASSDLRIDETTLAAADIGGHPTNVVFLPTPQGTIDGESAHHWPGHRSIDCPSAIRPVANPTPPRFHPTPFLLDVDKQ